MYFAAIHHFIFFMCVYLLLLCRCVDLPPVVQFKLCMMTLLYVIPGTPKCMEAYRQPLDMDWARAGRDGKCIGKSESMLMRVLL